MCLSASISLELLVQSSPTFLCMTPIALAWSSSGGVAIHYVPPDKDAIRHGLDIAIFNMILCIVPSLKQEPSDANVPVEILSDVERLGYMPNKNRSNVSLTAYVKVLSHSRY